MADTHTYEFNVTMSCGGCSGAIDRVLKKLDGMARPCPCPSVRRTRCGAILVVESIELTNVCVGVESYEVSLEDQKAKVITGLPYETVLEKIAKTGKKINSATADGVEKSVAVPAAA
jgi:copper chaperone